MKNVLRHLSSFIAPVVMGLVLPYLILRWEKGPEAGSFMAASIAFKVAGFVVSAAGLIFFIATVQMFIRIGRGTIMPWDPTRKLIVVSLYAHVRNPMILSVLAFQVGLAILFASYGIALLAVLFYVINTVYFIYSEEPGLERRFGEEYREYKKNVPRWIPRMKPWRPVT